MQKYVKFPFLFFLLAACVGLLLRWHLMSPVSWLKFPYWLHAHSHLMFLGWIFNLLSLAFIHSHIAEHLRKKYIILFLITQVLVLSMLISFPLQGYGFYSILISALHTLVVAVFTIWFLKDTKNNVADPSCWFARISLIFFLVSALGPFSLGPLMVNGLVYSKWYYFAVYYYLHFQYNGVFTFGVFSLFFGLLKGRGVIVNQPLVKRFGYFMLFACFPGYFLSTLWAKSGLFFNIIGLVAALMQVMALIYFIKIVKSIPTSVTKNVSFSARILFTVAFLSFIIKLILQTLSAHPHIAQLAYEVRNYVMAYLHLVLVGMMSSFLLAWSMEKRWLHKNAPIGVFFFAGGFIGMEIMLVVNSPFMGLIFESALGLMFFSSIMLSGLLLMFYKTFFPGNKNPQ